MKYKDYTQDTNEKKTKKSSRTRKDNTKTN